MIGKRYKEKKKSIGENRYTVDSYPIGLTI